MSKISFITSSQYSNLTDDDRLAIPYLKKMGLEVVPVIWDDNNVDWKQFDLNIVRSTWDYWDKIGHFRQWLSKMKLSDMRLLNSPDTIFWNLDKSYLKDLEDKGADLLPTIWHEFNSSVELTSIIEESGWDKVVVKPAISANAAKTFLVSTNNRQALSDVTAQYIEGQLLMIQPYLNEIETEGEQSLIFFNREFSHAVIKKPAPKDFRVQESHGGKIVPYDVSSEAIEQAKKILSLVPGEILYGRVDMVRRDKTFFLMELELIEPSLFLNRSKDGAQKFAKAIKALLF